MVMGRLRCYWCQSVGVTQSVSLSTAGVMMPMMMLLMIVLKQRSGTGVDTGIWCTATVEVLRRSPLIDHEGYLPRGRRRIVQCVSMW
eukprot:COSAG01_NODE_2357_length_7839_cov_6.117571_5_plen_87_part_00